MVKPSLFSDVRVQAAIMFTVGISAIVLWNIGMKHMGPYSITYTIEYGLFFTFLAGLGWGLFKIGRGVMNIWRGEPGVLDILGGVFFCVAPTLVYNVFQGFNSQTIPLSACG